MAAVNNGGGPVVKGKRTKRRRALPTPPAASPASSSGAGESSGSIAGEEDMANCLILLAQGHRNRHRKATPAAGGKRRVHQCSICGSEFASGQALGGHMRRHRPAIAGETQEAKKEQRRSFLCVDLNLPAPSDHEGFPFAGDHPPPVLAVAGLVGCHH